MPYFQAFQPVSVTVTFFMNSITFVMNHLFSYFDISMCHSSNRTLSYRLLLTHGFNHGYVLGGECSIQLSYDDTCRKPLILLGFWDFSRRPYIRLSALLQAVNHRFFCFDAIRTLPQFLNIPAHSEHLLKYHTIYNVKSQVFTEY